MASQIVVPPMLTSVPLCGLDDGAVWTRQRRRSLREEFKAGELTELSFDAVTFRAVYPNANYIRFREEELGAFAMSFAGQPFLRDHATYRLDARDGTITGASLAGYDFRQTITLTTPRGIEDFLNGIIDRFSIGWYWQSVRCSVTGEDWFASPYRPGQVVTVDGKQQVAEIIFVEPYGKETSAVNAPAVHGTHIISSLQDLCSFKEEVQDRMSKQFVVEEKGKAEAEGQGQGEGGRGGGIAGRRPGRSRSRHRPRRSLSAESGGERVPQTPASEAARQPVRDERPREEAGAQDTRTGGSPELR